MPNKGLGGTGTPTGTRKRPVTRRFPFSAADVRGRARRRVRAAQAAVQRGRGARVGQHVPAAGDAGRRHRKCPPASLGLGPRTEVTAFVVAGERGARVRGAPLAGRRLRARRGTPRGRPRTAAAAPRAHGPRVG